jgi:hypothetical protein
VNSEQTSTRSFAHFSEMDSGNPSEVACRVATSGVPKTSETLFGCKKRSALVGKD